MPFPLSPGDAHPLGPMGAVAVAGASLVAAAAVGSIFLRTAYDAWEAVSLAGPASPADGILLLASLGGLLLAVWLGLGMALSALSALPGAVGHACRRLASRIAPAAVRKAMAFVLGTTLSAALVPGSAAAGHEPPHAAVASAAIHAVGAVSGLANAAADASFRLISERAYDKDGHEGYLEAAPPPSWSPTRFMAPKRSAPSPAPPATPTASMDGIVVLRGDTLWSIAARRLAPTATATEIAAECQRWFAGNRAVIGDDANLILPGQVLSPPPSSPSPRERS